MEPPPGAGVQAYYAESAERLATVYESVRFESVHGALPESPARVLDVGAGTGRDAAALAGRGFMVDAVEPVTELRRVAERLHQGTGVTWRAGALPSLHGVQGPYDAVLLSAVWMHLRPEERPVAMRRLAGLLASGGILLITGVRQSAERGRQSADASSARRRSATRSSGSSAPTDRRMKPSGTESPPQRPRRSAVDRTPPKLVASSTSRSASRKRSARARVGSVNDTTDP